MAPNPVLDLSVTTQMHSFLLKLTGFSIGILYTIVLMLSILTVESTGRLSSCVCRAWQWGGICCYVWHELCQILHEPKKILDFVVVLGCSPFLNMLHLVGFSVDSLNINDMAQTINVVWEQVYFRLEGKKCASLSLWSTIIMCSKCSLSEFENMNILSRYMCMNFLIKSQKVMVISCWNVDGVLQSPICMTWLWNVPKMVEDIVLYTSSGLIWVCS